ncbi:hypothetical protein RSAG8_00928, partial [Rhizoctonia solani AG-8 WAC10335]
MVIAYHTRTLLVFLLDIPCQTEAYHVLSLHVFHLRLSTRWSCRRTYHVELLSCLGLHTLSYLHVPNIPRLYNNVFMPGAQTTYLFNTC